jgi:hypothetical protein
MNLLPVGRHYPFAEPVHGPLSLQHPINRRPTDAECLGNGRGAKPLRFISRTPKEEEGQDRQRS